MLSSWGYRRACERAPLLVRSGCSELSCHDEVAIFCVKDEGIGIPPEEQKELFTPFHRATNTQKIKGTGLGLSIVKRCVDVHGGQISVDSNIGLGTKFTVTLPLEGGKGKG